MTGRVPAFRRFDEILGKKKNFLFEYKKCHLNPLDRGELNRREGDFRKVAET
jgi:hypothetical protein